MTLPAIAVGNGEMHIAGAVFLFEIGMTCEAERVAVFFEQELIGKAVTFMAGLAVFGFDRGVHRLFRSKLGLRLGVTVVALLGSFDRSDRQNKGDQECPD